MKAIQKIANSLRYELPRKLFVIIVIYKKYLIAEFNQILCIILRIYLNLLSETKSLTYA